MDLNVLKKALTKASQLRLGIDETVELVSVYMSVADDIGGPGSLLVPQAGPVQGLLFQSQPEPPPIIHSINGAPFLRNTGLNSGLSQVGQATRLSAMSSINSQSKTAYQPKTVDEIFDDIERVNPGEVSVTAPGFKHPMLFSVEAYKREDAGTAGMVFYVAGDRSQVAGRVVYQTDKPYDVQRDIDEFVEAQKQIFKARSNPVVARTVAPSQWGTNMEHIGDFSN